MDTNVDTTKPMIRAASAPWSPPGRASDRLPVPGPWFKFVESRAVDLKAMDPEDLRIFLFNRLAIGKHAADRGKSAFGRAYNRIVGEDPNYVELSGQHTKQVLAFAKVDIKTPVDPLGNYNLRRDIVERELARVTQDLEKTAT